LAMEAGADGYVLKRAIATDLLPAVDAILEMKNYISSGIKPQDYSSNTNHENKEKGR